MFDEIPISTIKLPEGRFQTLHDISLSAELRWKLRRAQNESLIKEQALMYQMSWRIKIPKAGEDAMLLLRNGKFVYELKVKLELSATDANVSIL